MTTLTVILLLGSKAERSVMDNLQVSACVTGRKLGSDMESQNTEVWASLGRKT